MTDRTRRTSPALRLTPLAALVAGLCSMGLPAAQAQTPNETEAAAVQQLGGVTVRSRHRIEKLQDVPLSISVVQGAELDRLGAYSIDDVTKRAANVSWNLGNQRTSSISIRGIGKIGQTEAQDPSVGIIVDGVSFAYNALTSSFDFVDIDTIEVTRGPQGTLLGKNASVGNLIFTTKRPSFTPTADISIGFRENQGLVANAAIGGPVIDGLLAWRGTFSVSRIEGDLVNQYNRDISYTNTDRASGRVQFLLTPSPDFKARFAFDLQPRAAETTNGRSLVRLDAPTTWSNGQTITTLNNEQRLNRRWFKDNEGYSVDEYKRALTNDSVRGLVTGSSGATADLNWQLPGGHNLTSITAWKNYHFNAVNDDSTPFDVYRNAGGFWNDYRQASQELRIASPTGGFVDYQAGLYYIAVNNQVDYRRWWGNDAGAWFATNAQYGRLDADGAGRDLLRNSLAHVKTSWNSPTGYQDIRNKSAAVFAQANWRFSDALTLTTGARLTREDRRNVGRSEITSDGSAGELNPSIVNGVLLGGFDSYLNTGAARWVRDGLVVAANTPGAVQVTAGTAAAPTVTLTTDSRDAARVASAQAAADAAARKYFNAANWAALTVQQQRQLADAQAIRKSAVGVLFDRREAEPFKDTQPAWVISPSWKISPEQTAYLSYQHGEKAGIAQFVNGVSSLVKPEKTDSVELGLKSSLFKRTLVLNADVFLTRIRDYQQSVRIVDAYGTGLQADGTTVYTSATGNAPEVEVKGLEIDGVYSGIRNLTLRFSAAINDAKYKKFPNSAQPAENGFPGAPAYRDLSGRPLAGSPKYSGNLGIDYRLPVSGDKAVTASANIAFSSSFYSDNALSEYSVIPKSTTVDGAIGWGGKAFQVSLLVKNLFDDDTPRSLSATAYAPALPRSFGIQFLAKL